MSYALLYAQHATSDQALIAMIDVIRSGGVCVEREMYGLQTSQTVAAGAWQNRRKKRTLTAEASFDAPPSLSHSAMIAAVAHRGDSAAFAEIFTYFAPRVKSYLMRLGLAPAAAEDLAQDCMLSVWRKAALFDPSRAAASTWIFTIARNLRIDTARRKTHPETQDDPLNEPPDQPDAALTADQEQARIAKALSHLPQDQAEVVHMAFFADKTHVAIAEELGLPLGTVKSRVRLAMMRLRAALGDER